MKRSVCEPMLQIFFRVLNECLKMFENALSVGPVEKRYADSVALEIEKLGDTLKKLNIIDRSNIYAFIHPEFKVIFICLRVTTFRKIASKTIGAAQHCTIMYYHKDEG